MNKFSVNQYMKDLTTYLNSYEWTKIEVLAEKIWKIWLNNRRLFLCGNGGSSANAEHLANDLLFGVSPGKKAIRVNCLSSNSSVITCLANDTGYQNIFSLQLLTHGEKGDGLVVLSGSGNSDNVVEALKVARDTGMWTCGIVGYTGGKIKTIADTVIHFPVNDMQMAEDFQLIVGHCLMRILKQKAERKDQSCSA
jgi:D-sedoheptulose 7-phosphate isomerase